MIAASSLVPRKPKPDDVPLELRKLAVAVMLVACEDALGGEWIDAAGLRPWAYLAGLKPERVDDVLARAKVVWRGW